MLYTKHYLRRGENWIHIEAVELDDEASFEVCIDKMFAVEYREDFIRWISDHEILDYFFQQLENECREKVNWKKEGF